MKKALATLALLVLLSWASYLGGAWGVTLMLSGCTTSQQQVQYRTLKSIAVSVDAALRAYSDLAVHGEVDAATQAKVNEAKGRYADAMTAAIAAAKSSTEPAPVSVQQLADSLVAILTAATKPAGGTP